jgi:hypothetical protein
VGGLNNELKTRHLYLAKKVGQGTFFGRILTQLNVTMLLLFMRLCHLRKYEPKKVFYLSDSYPNAFLAFGLDKRI